jgi:hypothetical protein
MGDAAGEQQQHGDGGNARNVLDGGNGICFCQPRPPAANPLAKNGAIRNASMKRFELWRIAVVQGEKNDGSKCSSRELYAKTGGESQEEF